MTNPPDPARLLNIVFIGFLIALAVGIAMLFSTELGGVSGKGWILVIIGIIGAAGIFAYKKYS